MPAIRKSTKKRKAMGLALALATNKSSAPVNTQHPPQSSPPKVTDEFFKNEIKKPELTCLKRELEQLNCEKKERRCEMHDSGNRIVHWDSLKSILTSNLVCKQCGHDICVTENTIGIATEVQLGCKNRHCNMHAKYEAKKTDCERNKFRKGTSESFAINCQFILALMQTGCGGSEASVLLTFLDLPHSSTFHKSTFARVKEAIRPAIVEISDQSKCKARDAEVLQTMGETKFNDWKQNKLQASEVKLTISYDMGWNKRSSGNKYDSMSGHGFVLGGRTKKILQHMVLSKQCSKCSIAAAMKRSAEEHECPKNHTGSSKSMECEAIFRMVKEAYYKHKYSISTIISDDDSTMKSNLKHSFEKKIEAGKMKKSEWPKTNGGSKKKDTGRLPLEIEDPSFLADFNHRMKVVGKSAYFLASMPKKESMVNKATAERE